ncbi:hypothetical protein [Thermococcus sp.]
MREVMPMKDKPLIKLLCGSLVFLSLFLQAEYFGSWSAIRTIGGSAVAFMLMLSICWAGRRLNSQSCMNDIVRYIIGYTKLSGAKGKPRQLFALFVGYFAFSGLANLPLVDGSTRFFLSLFPLAVGLVGVTYGLIERNCRKHLPTVKAKGVA